MNKREFASLLKRYGDTQETLATFLGISRTCLNSKVNERNGASFTQPELKAIKEKYNLSVEEFNRVFF